tara:strand:+ start:37042 stop:37260 length:219 start_codon:yes stop_codon:yes gene_type:complete
MLSYSKLTFVASHAFSIAFHLLLALLILLVLVNPSVLAESEAAFATAIVFESIFVFLTVGSIVPIVKYAAKM